MIVDTSALIAILYRETGYLALLGALTEGPGILPAPAFVEFQRVATSRGARRHPAAEELIEMLTTGGMEIAAFTREDAQIVTQANIAHGTGNGRGGTLNQLDLMVYAVAKRLGRPILCTGNDFAQTGIAIHPASRRD